MSEISPFFVLEAEQMILAELYDDAIELCKIGLEEYPEYVSAWTILARAYHGQGNLSAAQSTINESKKYIPDNKIIYSFELALSNNDNAKSTQTLMPDVITVKNESEEEVQVPDIDSMFTVEKSEDINLYQSYQEETNDLIEEKIEHNENQESKNKSEIIKTENSKDSVKDFETSDIIIQEENIQDDNNREIEINFSIGFLKDFISEGKMNISASKIDAVYGLDSVIHKSIILENFERTSFRDIFIPEVVNIPKKDFVNPNNIQDETCETIRTPFESKLADIAKQLEEVSIPRNIEEEHNSSQISDSKPSILTETIANIYLQQGAYEEAAKAYKELLIQNPDKKDYFLNKIDTLIHKIK